jgi:ubiquinone/menaquinone biosynthesis C-methylase UbiE
MISLQGKKAEIMDYMDLTAPVRDKWIRLNRYYYKDLTKFLKYHIPENSSIIEIGCGTGYLLNSLNPSRGVGIDISAKMTAIAAKNYPHLEFFQMDAENITLQETFDYIIISDTLGYFEDIQKSFKELHKLSNNNTRIIITYHNFLWNPALKFSEWVSLKMPQRKLNWLNKDDICKLLYLENFDIIKTGRRLLIPVNIPLISWFFNKVFAPLPLFNSLCLTGYIIGRKISPINQSKDLSSVSVVIPARNEKGNIENAILRIPEMGSHTEIVFVEGNSTDSTLDEIKRVTASFSGLKDIKYFIQPGKGKADAVRMGFENASCDILMILDADLTVPPEELPKFYDAIVNGKGEFINGSRLVYPLEKQAMQFLNIVGNKFFSVMFSWLLGQRLKDTLCGTKVLTKNNYEKIKSNRKYFGDFDPFGDFDLIFGASKLSLKIVEVPVWYKAREYGETNISRFKHGWLLLKMMFFAMNKIKFR